MPGLTSFLNGVAASRPRFEPVGRRLVIAFLSGLIVASASYSLYQVLDEDRGDHIRRVVVAEAERVRTEFAAPLESTARDIETLSRNAVAVGPTAAWEAEAAQLIEKNPRLRAVAWYDTTFAPRAAVPGTSRLPGFDLDPRDDGERLRHLLVVAERGGVSYSATVVLADSRREVLIGVPVMRGDRWVGHVVGALRVRDLIDELSDPSLKRGFAVAIYEGPFLLFGPVWQDGGDEATWETDAALQTHGLFWVIQVWPSSDLMREIDPLLPEWTLAFGLTLALVFAIGVYRFLVWKERALAMERVAAAASDAPLEGFAVTEDPGLETPARAEPASESSPATLDHAPPSS